MKKSLLVLLLTVVFAVPAYSQMKDMEMKGQCNEQMMGMDKMGNMASMCIEHAKKIGLTDQQIDKITPIHRAMQKNQVRFKADLKIAEIELMEIMDVKDFDIDKANAAVQKIAGIKTTHHLEMIKSMKEVRSILTDEEFKKMKQMMPMMMDGKKPHKMMKHK